MQQRQRNQKRVQMSEEMEFPYMLADLKHYKNELVTALEKLPDLVKIPADEDALNLTEENISDQVRQDITNLEEFWEFIEEYHDKSVIALIGMVNAGKSALGNHYAYQGESGLFEEAPIRQTSKASQAELDRNQLLIDLPGLGSVLSQDDDQIVKEIIRRANLLLIVIGINQPIPDHLYQFLQSDEVLKTWNAQRIVIVLNKIDILDSFPEVHRNKTLEKYINFLKYGNPDMDFPGIASLFDYEIPIIPFSVFHARNGIDQWRENTLRQTIMGALDGASHSCLLRAKQELIDYCLKYSTLVAAYFSMKQKAIDISESVDALIPRLISDLEAIISTEMDSLYSTLVNIKDGCFDAMQTYQPNSAEHFWRGTEWQTKKSNLGNCRDRYKSKMCRAFDNFSYNFRDAIVSIIRGTFGDCGSLYLPNSESIYEPLKSVIYVIWDVFDDVYFRDHDADSYHVQNKLSKIGDYFESAATEINTWKNTLVERALSALQEAHNQSTTSKIESYISACADLEDFCQVFTETRVFRELLVTNLNHE